MNWHRNIIAAGVMRKFGDLRDWVDGADSVGCYPTRLVLFLG